MSRMFVLLLAAVAVSYCGSNKESSDAPQEGELRTANGKFFVKPSRTDLGVHDQEVHYEIRQSSDRALLSTETFNLSIQYGMPSMNMPNIPPAVITKDGESKWKVKYHFVHGGDWRIQIEIKRGETVEDRLVQDIHIHAAGGGHHGH